MDENQISIDKQTLGLMPTALFGGRIIVVDKADDVAAAIESISACKLIGFDTETRPTFKKGVTNTVSLLQLSTDDTCWLIRLNKTGLTDPVKRLLEDPGVTKVGLSVKDDFNALHRIGSFEPAAFVDLQQMVHQYGIADNSLQKIYGIIFGMRISKGQRLTNWDSDTLTQSQCLYASTDAWACLRIYDTLMSGAFDIDRARANISSLTNNQP